MKLRHSIQVVVILTSLLLIISNASAQVLSNVVSNHKIIKDIETNQKICLNGSRTDESSLKDEKIDFPKESENRRVKFSKISSDTIYLLISDSIEIWDTLSSTWLVISKTAYFYDKNQNEIELVKQGWRDSLWENQWKYVFTYDTNNNNRKDKSFWAWIGNQWTLYAKFTFTYDSTDKLIEELYLSWEGNSWINLWKYIYIYTKGGGINYKLEYYWADSTWVLDWKDTYTFDEDNNLAEILYQWRDSSSWDNIGKASYLYDVNGKLVEHLYQIWRNDTWVNGFKYTYLFDLGGHELEELYQVWDDSVWNNYYKNIFNYCIEGIQLGYLSQRWNGSLWIDEQKHTYTWQMLITDVNEQSNVISKFSLSDNYPNPFNPITQITFSVPKAINITLKVYDVLGREIGLLVNERKQPGEYNVTWNAEGVPSGVYFYRIVAGEFIEAKKMVVIR